MTKDVKEENVQMNQNLTAEINHSIQEFRFPGYEEIPDVGLFLEQVAKYVSGFLEPLGDTITITSSMISNYVKKKLIGNPVKKQYYRDQIADIFFIAVAKSVLSLENIQLLLEIQKNHYDTREAYEFFCSEFESILRYEGGLQDSLSSSEPEAADEKIMLKNTIITAVHKIYLDKYFEKLHEINEA